MDLIAEKIDAIKEDRGPARQYLGASGVGHPCDAYLAFSLRGFPDTPPSAQLLRIFREGHRIEDQVVADLKKAGFFIEEVDPITGKQYEFKEFGGHVVGHADGLISLGDDEVALLEIKSMNDSKFRKFKSEGVRSSHPMYNYQCQLMMGLSGKYRKAVLVAYNKNTSAYASETIEFSETDFSYLKARIQVVLSNEARKISKDETDWRCRSCFKKDACWQSVTPIKECASCIHCAADPDDRWHCMKHKTKAVAVCSDYEIYKPLDKA